MSALFPFCMLSRKKELELARLLAAWLLMRCVLIQSNPFPSERQWDLSRKYKVRTISRRMERVVSFY